MGWYDYLRNPPRESWQGPFNNQDGRKQIFADLRNVCEFEAIVETGTFRGDTTEFMHQQSQLPVYSAELYPRFFSCSKLRLRHMKDINLFCADSVSFLQGIWRKQLVPNRGLFFYLDAHWYAKLPAKEETAFIFEKWPDAVVMIDDFQVPDDSGYKFDDYGEAGVLSLALFEGPFFVGVRKWFPRLPSERETGAKRGVVVLAKDSKRCEILGAIETLREYVPQGQ